MSLSKTDKQNLQKRYLLWFYKDVKEKFDKIERKFTQLEADQLIAKKMKALSKDCPQGSHLERLIKEFDVYMVNKEKEGVSLKFSNSASQELRPEYVYLKIKLQSVESAIEELFGAKELEKMKDLYEEEMTERILKATIH